MTSPRPDERQLFLRRLIFLPHRPRHAWLRVTTGSAYRLAVNGMVVDQQESQLGTTTPVPPVRRTYDITNLARRGTNTIALVLTSGVGPPHVLADVEVEDTSGKHVQAGTDKQWLQQVGPPADWLKLQTGAAEGWQPCIAETGDLGIPPWVPRREVVTIPTPAAVVLRQVAQEVALIVVLFFLTQLACLGAGRLLGQLGGTPPGAWTGTVYLPLVPVTVALAAAFLVVYDPRVYQQHVYRGLWLFVALAAVPVQWLVLGLVAGFREADLRALAARLHPSGWVTPAGRPTRALRLVLTGAFLLSLLVVGTWLRVRNVGVEAIFWDEVDIYKGTTGLLETGFPSNHEIQDLPRTYINTAELVYYYTAVTEFLGVDRDIYVVRIPAMIWSVLTILLLYQAGRRMFSEPVGLVAAALLTLSPVSIAMSNFGRYFAQLQFFSVLCVYWYWMCLRGSGPINKKYLWLTSFAFLATYLSWEGGGLLATGMILAMLVLRRGRLHTVLGEPLLWAALLFDGVGIVIQLSHRFLQQTEFMWYGISLSDTSLRPMWKYPQYETLYYVWESSWNSDAFLPMLTLVGAIILSIRHPYRQQFRFLLLIYLLDCTLLASILPNMTWRYIHQLVGLQILIAAAVLVAVVHSLARLTRQVDIPALWRGYGWAVRAALLATFVVVGSGLWAELREMPAFRVQGFGVTVFKFPAHEASVKFVRDRLQDGDVVFCNEPHQIDHCMRHNGRPGWRSDYWIATNLEMPAIITDRSVQPLDRREGTEHIANMESLELVFAKHPRIWYIVEPGAQGRNGSPSSSYLRQHMDVVYEDWYSMVLFRGDNHRPAFLRAQNEKTLGESGANYLPP
jgi:4-amino-4-deoxy-L-arabinose transferase-like glycosyltransferase